MVEGENKQTLQRQKMLEEEEEWESQVKSGTFNSYFQNSSWLTAIVSWPFDQIMQHSHTLSATSSPRMFNHQQPSNNSTVGAKLLTIFELPIQISFVSLEDDLMCWLLATASSPSLFLATASLGCWEKPLAKRLECSARERSVGFRAISLFLPNPERANRDNSKKVNFISIIKKEYHFKNEQTIQMTKIIICHFLSSIYIRVFFHFQY